MAKVKRPVRDLEVERLARESIELHHSLKSPVTESAMNAAMTLYGKTFGEALALAFLYREHSRLWEVK